MRRRKRLRSNMINPQRFDRSQIKFYGYLLPIAFVMALPIIFTIFSAFKPIDELFHYPPRFLPRKWTLSNFRSLFALTGTSTVPASRYLLNSLLSTGAVVVLSVLMSVSAGYVLSKKHFKGRNVLFQANTYALMFVPIAVSIPYFFVVYYLRLLDNFLVHIIPILAAPVGLFLVKQFIDQLPDALFDAAKVDGASDYFILIKIVFPMVGPAIATIAIMAFQSSWNALQPSTTYINNDTLRTFAYYMNSLNPVGAASVAGIGVSSAASMILLLPNLIMFIFLQSRVMNTMAHSGIK